MEVKQALTVSEACQINDLDLAALFDDMEAGVSEACQINDLDLSSRFA